MAGKIIMNFNLNALVEMVEEQFVLSEQGNTQTIYKTSVKLRINKKEAET